MKRNDAVDDGSLNQVKNVDKGMFEHALRMRILRGICLKKNSFENPIILLLFPRLMLICRLGMEKEMITKLI